MSRYLALVACLALAGCPSYPPPAPVPPDAADGAATPVQDAAVTPPMPNDPCGMACLVMTRLCGPQRDDCLRTMAAIDRTPGAFRKPNGQRLTCLDVASASTVDQLRSLGVPCP